MTTSPAFRTAISLFAALMLSTGFVAAATAPAYAGPIAQVQTV